MHLSHNPRLAALKPALLLALLLTAFGHAPARAAEPRVSLARPRRPGARPARGAADGPPGARHPAPPRADPAAA